MKEFLEKNQTTWEWDMGAIPQSSFHGNIFCFGSDKSKNLTIAKRAAENALEFEFPCVIVTRDPNAWADILDKAKAAGYMVAHHINEECAGKTEEECGTKSDQIEAIAEKFYDSFLEMENFILVLEIPASIRYGKGTTLLELLLTMLTANIDDDVPPVQVIMDDADGRLCLLPPDEMFSLNVHFCVTMGDQITNRDWREETQYILCENFLAPRSESFYDVVRKEDADASYERFFNLFPLIISSGVNKDIVSQMRYFMFQCLTMLPSKKRNLALPFLALRKEDYEEARFEKIARFYEEYMVSQQIEAANSWQVFEETDDFEDEED